MYLYAVVVFVTIFVAVVEVQLAVMVVKEISIEVSRTLSEFEGSRFINMNTHFRPPSHQ